MRTAIFRGAESWLRLCKCRRAVDSEATKLLGFLAMRHAPRTVAVLAWVVLLLLALTTPATAKLDERGMSCNLPVCVCRGSLFCLLLSPDGELLYELITASNNFVCGLLQAGQGTGTASCYRVIGDQAVSALVPSASLTQLSVAGPRGCGLAADGRIVCGPPGFSDCPKDMTPDRDFFSHYVQVSTGER